MTAREGVSISLEVLREAHAIEMFALLSDERVSEYTLAAPNSLDALVERFRHLETQRSADGNEHWLNWIVRDDRTHAAVGFVQATVVEAERRATIGYIIGAPFWNRGYATAAVREMFALLEERYAIATYLGTVDGRNTHSIALLARFGFVCVDTSDPCDHVYVMHASARSKSDAESV